MKPYNLILAFGLTISAVPATAAENDYKAFADQQAAAFMANTLVQDALAANNSAHAAYRLCLECGGNSLAAFSEHVDLGLIRPRGQG